jgi:hypothetical protein
LPDRGEIFRRPGHLEKRQAAALVVVPQPDERRVDRSHCPVERFFRNAALADGRREGKVD